MRLNAFLSAKYDDNLKIFNYYIIFRNILI